MTVTRYNTEAMEACRSAVAGAAGPLRAVGEGLTDAGVDVGACGSVAGGRTVGLTLDGVVAGLAAEYAVAGQRLDDTAVALDATRTAVKETEAGSTASFRRTGPAA